MFVCQENQEKKNEFLSPVKRKWKVYSKFHLYLQNPRDCVCFESVVCDSQGSYTVYLDLDRLQHVGPGFVDHSYCKATLEI